MNSIPHKEKSGMNDQTDSSQDDLDAISTRVEEGKKPTRNALQEVTQYLEFSSKGQTAPKKATPRQ